MTYLIKKVFTFMQYGLLLLRNVLSRRQMPRIPESFQLTEAEDSVREYGLVMNSVMTAPYAVALEFAHRCTPSSKADRGRNALDLCTGPGHFANCLSKYLDYEQITGVDLSQPMIELASRHSQENVNFQLGNVEKLVHQRSNSYDLVSFLNGAHHLDAIQNVSNVLAEAERVAKPSGVILVMDPVRLKTAQVTEQYINIAGESYRELGLDAFHQDFRETMYASFTPEEFVTAVPKNTQRTWVYIVPKGLPTFQVLIGLPLGMAELPTRESLATSVLKSLVPASVWADYKMLAGTFKFGKMTTIKPISRFDYTRQDVRIWAGKETQLFLPRNSKKIGARIVDISVTGFGAVLEERLSAGSQVQILVPNGSHNLTKVAAECVWSQGYRHGFKITDLTPTWQKSLVRFHENASAEVRQ